jgi:hypothetical protein
MTDGTWDEAVIADGIAERRLLSEADIRRCD